VLSVIQHATGLFCRAVSSVMQCVAVCCIVLQCVAVCCYVFIVVGRKWCVAVRCSVLQCFAVCYGQLAERSVLQCMTVCVAVHCRVFGSRVRYTAC